MSRPDTDDTDDDTPDALNDGFPDIVAVRRDMTRALDAAGFAWSIVDLIDINEEYTIDPHAAVAAIATDGRFWVSIDLSSFNRGLLH